MPETDEAVFSITINAPIQRVWDEITKTNAVQPAYFAAVLRSSLEPGAPLAYTTEDESTTYIDGQIIDVYPPHRFAHTFRFTHLDDAPSHVEWELTEESESSTKVVIVHSKLAPKGQTRKDVSSGWPRILDALKSFIETGTIPEMSEQGTNQ